MSTNALHLVPKGATPVGVYHTHGDYSLLNPPTGATIRTKNPANDLFNSDHFPPSNIAYSDWAGRSNSAYRVYLGTPIDTFWAYSLSNKTRHIIK